MLWRAFDGLVASLKTEDEPGKAMLWAGEISVAVITIGSGVKKHRMDARRLK